MPRPQITQFGIGNFRAFAAQQDVPLRPITLLFGPNNVGKSSFARGLALFAHFLGSRWPQEADLIADLHAGAGRPDVGDFSTYIHDAQAAQLTASVGVPISDVVAAMTEEPDGSGKAEEWSRVLREVLRDFSRVRLDYSYGEVNDERGRLEAPGPSSPETSGEWDLLRWSLQLRLETGEGHWMEARATLGPRILEALSAHRPDDGHRERILKAAKKHFLGIGPPLRLQGHPEEGTFWAAMPSLRGTAEGVPDLLIGQITPPISEEFFYTASGVDAAGHLRGMAELALSLLGHFADAIVVRAAGRVRSIGPLRSVPPRFDNAAATANAFGEAWSSLIESAEMREDVGDWLTRLSGGSGRIGLRLGIIGPELPPSVTNVEELANALQPLVQTFLERYRASSAADPTVRHLNADQLDPSDIAVRWAERLHKPQYMANKHSIRLVEGDDPRSRAIRDTGLGMSQLIPVVVELLGNETSIVVIEQPELHLHPAVQAECGDLLIESALGRRQNMLVAETHSEHLLLRIMRRIRETAEGRIPPHEIQVRPEDVSLVFFERVDGVPVARMIELDERGMITRPWPGGFFEEGFREIFA